MILRSKSQRNASTAPSRRMQKNANPASANYKTPPRERESLRRIKSVSDLLEFIKTKKKEWAEKRFPRRPRDHEPVRMLFRGVRNWEYNLVPQLARKKIYERLSQRFGEAHPTSLEREVLGRFKRYAYRFVANPHALAEVEWLCLAQHYRLPTLLLDWTTDPLVNLYFATSKIEASTDAALYAMVLKRHSDRPTTTYRIGDGEEEEPLYPMHRGRHLAPLQTRGRALIVPDMSEPRIVAQSGRFIYMRPEFLEDGSPSEIVDMDMDAPRGWLTPRPWEDECVIKLLIPKENIASIRETLEDLQMHEARVFPSLEKYASRIGDGHWS
jgi:hypothetical protein